MSQTPPVCTSMCCLCTAIVDSRARVPSSCGATCSTCAAYQVFAELCWSARTSWCPSTSRLASRREDHQKSLYPTWTSERWSTRSVGRHMLVGTAAASLLHLSSTYWPLRWTQDRKDKQNIPQRPKKPVYIIGQCVFVDWAWSEVCGRTVRTKSGFTSPRNKSYCLQLIMWLIRHQIIFSVLSVAHQLWA